MSGNNNPFNMNYDHTIDIDAMPRSKTFNEKGRAVNSRRSKAKKSRQSKSRNKTKNSPPLQPSSSSSATAAAANTHQETRKLKHRNKKATKKAKKNKKKSRHHRDLYTDEEGFNSNDSDTSTYNDDDSSDVDDFARSPYTHQSIFAQAEHFIADTQAEIARHDQTSYSSSLPTSSSHLSSLPSSSSFSSSSSFAPPPPSMSSYQTGNITCSNTEYVTNEEGDMSGFGYNNKGDGNGANYYSGGGKYGNAGGGQRRNLEDISMFEGDKLAELRSKVAQLNSSTFSNCFSAVTSLCGQGGTRLRWLIEQSMNR